MSAAASPLTKTMIRLHYAGKKLSLLPSSTPDLLHLLQQLEEILSKVQQSPSELINNALNPIIKGIFAKELVRYADMNVNISVACCICEIMRIMAPENPCSDKQMKDLFEMVVITFEKLSSSYGGCYAKMTKILQTYSSIKLWVLMLDLKLDGHRLIVRLFKQFLTVAGSNSSAIVYEMEKIMTMIIDKSGDLALELLSLIVTTLKSNIQIASHVCWQLGEKVLMNYAVLRIPNLPDMREDMSIALYDYSKMVAGISDLALENETMEAKETIRYATHKIKPNCPEMLKSCQDAIQHTVLGIRSKGYEKHQKKCHTFSDDLPCPETLKSCQDAIRHIVLGLRSKGYENHEEKLHTFSNDPPKCFTQLNGKRKRNNSPLREQIQSVEHGEDLLGSRIKVWWPADRMYYPGVVTFFASSKKMHKVVYDDGDVELLNLKRERWKLLEYAFAVPGSLGNTLPHTTSVHGYNVKHSVAPVLEAIINKHGDIAAKCVFKEESVRASLLELVCDIVKQLELETDEVIDKIEEIENQVSRVDAVNINVSWLRANLEAIKKQMVAK